MKVDAFSSLILFRLPIPIPIPIPIPFSNFQFPVTDRFKHQQLVVFKTTEEKRYDFVTNSPEFASEIVEELKRGISPYREL